MDRWNRILGRKSLIISGPVIHEQLDVLQSRLSASGLWLAIELLADDNAANPAWRWSHTTSN